MGKLVLNLVSLREARHDLGMTTMVEPKKRQLELSLNYASCSSFFEDRSRYLDKVRLSKKQHTKDTQVM